MLPRLNRLRKKKDFERVLKKGKGFQDNFLFLKIAENTLPASRFGFIISKKISKKAVLRNKIRRRLRETVGQKLDKTAKGFDGILIAKPGIEKKDFLEIEKIVNKLFLKAKIL